MNRRGFLGFLATAMIATAGVTRLGKIAFELAPRSGGKTLLSVQQITREALRILHEKCDFIDTIQHGYDPAFAGGANTLRIVVPPRFAA